PELDGKSASADRRLEIKTEQRNRAGDLTAMGDQRLIGGVLKAGQRDQTDVVPAVARERRLGTCLLCRATDSCNKDAAAIGRLIAVTKCLCSQREHRFEQAMLRIANRKLRRMHADGDRP